MVFGQQTKVLPCVLDMFESSTMVLFEVPCNGIVQCEMIDKYSWLHASTL